MQKEDIPVGQLLDWLNRYGPLMLYLDDHTTGYGVVQVVMHGRRAVKAGPVGKMQKLDMIDFTVLAGSTEEPED